MPNVNLTDEDAELFVQFRKYQDQFKILLEKGLFDRYLGSISVHKAGTDVIQLVITTLTSRF